MNPVSLPTVAGSLPACCALPRRAFLKNLGAGVLVVVAGRTVSVRDPDAAGPPSAVTPGAPTPAGDLPGSRDEPAFFADPGWSG